MTREFDIHVPVLIVGGGGAGLTSSILLSRLGVSSLLVTRYPETTKVPRGHILNQRTMEIFTDMGVAEEIRAKGTPPENMRGVAWYSGLAGGGPRDGHGRLLGFVEAWSGGFTDPDYIAASPESPVNLSLLRTEPLLRAHAERYPGATLQFNHELVGLEQDEDGVTSTVLDRGTDETYTVRSAYVLGADAGRTVGDLVGAKVTFHDRLRKLISLYLAVDLSKYVPGDDSILTWVFNPEFPDHLDHGAVLVPQGPQRWDRHSEEWLLAVSRPDLDASQPEKMVQWASEALGIPDLAPKVLGVSEWHLERFLIDDFRAGRVFLLGDAAHRLPPSGGLGLNSAVQDAYNLCWKLAAVLAGRAGDGLLDSYSAERRPVNLRNIETATKSVGGQLTMGPALGVSPEKSVEENWAALRLFWEDDLPGAEQRRHEFNEWLGQSTLEYHQHNVDFGYTYDSAAIVGDGSPVPVSPDPIRLYQASSRPGHPLPHAWVERAGRRRPLRSLIHGGHFALIAGEEGQDWIAAAEEIVRRSDIPLRTARVGTGRVDLIDIRLAWERNREISARGALLVRPDGYVAFRALGAVGDPMAVLSRVFRQILDSDDVDSRRAVG